jgi:hypothetical protein
MFEASALAEGEELGSNILHPVPIVGISRMRRPRSPRDWHRSIGLRPGADRAEIGARLRFGQIHRRRPLAGDELFQISLLEVFATVRGERFHAAEGQQRSNAESEARAVPHLRATGIEQLRQALPAIFGRTGTTRADVVDRMASDPNEP